MATVLVALSLCGMVSGKVPPADSLSSYVEYMVGTHGYIHRIALESHPSYVLPTHRFLKGENPMRKLIRGGHSAHLKYSFQFQPGTCIDRIYGGAYQGIGLAQLSFGESEYLGDPTALYLFQGARMARFRPRLSLNYEWKLGLSFGWKPYDAEDNNQNKVIGSKLNAYMNADFYLNWMISRHFDLNAGVALSHFSNGNTKLPNAGLNTVGLKVGLVYNFNRTEDCLSAPLYQSLVPKFPRHISYDLVMFGAWRRRGILLDDGGIVSPKAYPVFGINFTPMYNVGYRLRLGVSADFVYDSSANLSFSNNYNPDSTPVFNTPSFEKQLALGFSGRVEYVMPYFTVGLGIGNNVIHSGGTFKGYYQVLTLKMDVTRNSFIHVGYNLQNFENPNYLMLGIGYRFNNKYPNFRR